VLAISTATQELLNRNLIPVHSGADHAQHAFAPTCSITFLEQVLRENFERYVAAGFGRLSFGSHVPEPEELLAEGYDVVVVASGRQALADDWRARHDMAFSVGDSHQALILKYTTPAGKGLHLRPHAESAIAHAAGSGRVYLRPGAHEDQGYVWLVGVPMEMVTQFNVEHGEMSGPTTFGSFGEALTALAAGDSTERPASSSGGGAGGSDWLGAMMRLLDDKLHPVEVSARFTEASFWNSQKCTYRSSEPGAGWIALAGDAACGRPFFLGSTLNGHIHDVVPLAHGASWSNWDSEGVPLKKYEDRYKLRTSAIGFRRPGQPFAATRTCGSLPPVPAGPKPAVNPPVPAGCPVAPPACRPVSRAGATRISDRAAT